jgi:hypothetical protein
VGPAATVTTEQETPAAAAAPVTGGLLTHLQQRQQQRQLQGWRHCQLCFVDLAGCERVKRTGNFGARLKWVAGRDHLHAAHAPVSLHVMACNSAVAPTPIVPLLAVLSRPCATGHVSQTLNRTCVVTASFAHCTYSDVTLQDVRCLLLLLLLLQGECVDQQLADDIGALPGGAALQPAAPRNSRPEGHSLQGEQGEHSTVPYNTVQYSTVQCSAVQCSCWVKILNRGVKGS